MVINLTGEVMKTVVDSLEYELGTERTPQFVPDTRDRDRELRSLYLELTVEGKHSNFTHTQYRYLILCPMEVNEAFNKKYGKTSIWKSIDKIVVAFLPGFMMTMPKSHWHAENKIIEDNKPSLTRFGKLLML